MDEATLIKELRRLVIGAGLLGDEDKILIHTSKFHGDKAQLRERSVVLQVVYLPPHDSVPERHVPQLTASGDDGGQMEPYEPLTHDQWAAWREGIDTRSPIAVAERFYQLGQVTERNAHRPVEDAVLASIERVALLGAASDLSTDKSDWIRVWALTRMARGLPVTEEEWERAFDERNV